MQVWNVLHAARCKYRTQKIAKKSPPRHHRTTLSVCIFATKACIDNRKKLLSINISSTCPHNMANFGPLTAEIVLPVCGTPANCNGFRVLPALLHGILVVGVSQTLRRWTKVATYIRQGGHHVGHWPHSSWLFFTNFLLWFHMADLVANPWASWRKTCSLYRNVPLLQSYVHQN